MTRGLHSSTSAAVPPAFRWRRFAWAACWAVVVIVLAGCVKRGADTAGTQMLRISQRNEPTDLDPATASLPDEFFVIRALGEGLLVPNPRGDVPLPGLAESYEASPDGLTYTFHLRPGLLWSNGEPLTADDCVASFQRVLQPATAAPKAHLFNAVKNASGFIRGAIKDPAALGLRAVDAATVEITLGHAQPNFPLYVASGAWIPVNPRVIEAHGRSWTQPENYVGCGPFLLVEWRPQQRIIVRKNPRYWDAAHVHLSEIQFIRFDNADSEDRAYRAREVDVTMAVPQTKLAVYAQERPAELHRTPLAETRFIAFNTQRVPLNDVRVRRALLLAIDRERIVRDVLKGGQMPADRFLSPAIVGPNRMPLPAPAATSGTTEELPDNGPSRVTFDPDTARLLLAEAGFPNGRGFPKLELAGWDRNPVLEAVQQMWRRELGIDVHLVVQEAKVHLAALTAGNFDLGFATNLLDVRDPVTALADFTTAAPNNFAHWDSADFDRRIARGSAEIDRTAASRDLAHAERLLIDSAAVAPVYFNVQNWLMSPRVHGWEQDALWTRRYNDVYVDAK